MVAVLMRHLPDRIPNGRSGSTDRTISNREPGARRTGAVAGLALALPAMRFLGLGRDADD